MHIGEKHGGECELWYFGITSRNSGGYTLVGIVERNNLKIMNIFFRKHSNREGTCQIRKGVMKYEMVLMGNGLNVQNIQRQGKAKRLRPAK